MNRKNYKNTYSSQVMRNEMTEKMYQKEAKALNRRLRRLEETNAAIEKVKKTYGQDGISDSTFLTEYKYAQKEIEEALPESKRAGLSAKGFRLPERTKTLTDEQFSKLYKAVTNLKNLDLTKKHAATVYKESKKKVFEDMGSIGTSPFIQDIVDYAIKSESSWRDIRNAIGSGEAVKLYESVKKDPSINTIDVDAIWEGLSSALANGIKPYDHAAIFQYIKNWIKANYANQNVQTTNSGITGKAGTAGVKF